MRSDSSRWVGSVAGVPPPPASVPQLDPIQADELVRTGAVLLDVREADEFAAGHAPGAAHLPLGLLGARVDELAGAGPIVCVCRSGGRSDSAATALRASGYDARNLAGGMRAWAAEGLPVVREDGTPGSVI